MRKGVKLGAVIQNHLGYNVRHMLSSKGEHTGHYGIYAGKKFVQNTTIDMSYPHVEILVARSLPIRKSEEQAAARKEAEARKLTRRTW